MNPKDKAWEEYVAANQFDETFTYRRTFSCGFEAGVLYAQEVALKHQLKYKKAGNTFGAGHTQGCYAVGEELNLKEAADETMP